MSKASIFEQKKKHSVCFRIYKPRRDKTCLRGLGGGGGGGGVRHRQGFTATEDGRRLEISDLESRGIAADLRLCFPICKKQIFS